MYRNLGRAFFLSGRFSQIDLWRKYNRRFAALPETYLQAALEGIGWGIRERFREDKARALDWIGKIPGRDAAAALRGFNAYEAWYGL